MINGVKIIEVRKHSDNRGFLCEVARSSHFFDFKWKQTNYTLAHPGVIKAFHWHKKQTDLWFCIAGNIETVLYDRREGSKTTGETQTITMGEHNPLTVLIPKGVAHGYRVLGEQAAGLIYLVDQEYDSEKPDEERIPHDDKTIGFDWNTKPR
ncbi:MAG: dTDP-4-dehydrorhamnose 3,5-epimerase family protein [Patescibacteria group bacterium]